MAPMKDTDNIQSTHTQKIPIPTNPHLAPAVNCVCPYFTDTVLVTGSLSLDKGLSHDVSKAPLLRPSEIALGFMQLLDDETVAGQALCITPFKPPFFAHFKQPK